MSARDECLPPSLAASPNIPLGDQTDEQLVAERDYWQHKVDEAGGWGAGYSFAWSQHDACAREIARRARPRQGDWMQTFTGRMFWPMDPRADEVEIEDIAHALSMQCRYAGHCLRFYSVAEHCVLLAEHVDPQHALWALLHDASEAYLVDVPSPVKPFLAGYREAEARVMAAVAQRFGLVPEMPEAVKAADNGIRADEAAQNMAAPPQDWKVGPPLGIRLELWSPERAEAEFLRLFRDLQIVRTIEGVR